MTMHLAGDGPAITAAFLGSFVEFVEALTIVLAVGATRGWRTAVSGAALAALSLSVFVLIMGNAVSRWQISASIFQLIFGIALLLFGMRWLRKASLRGAGALHLHDEAAAFAKETARLAGGRSLRTFDLAGFATSFNGVLLEGVEVVFIVVATGAATGNIAGAGLGAGIAAILVLMLGLLLHRPLTRVPENVLKFFVGALLSALGTFWTGEALHIGWTGEDWALLWLIPAFLMTGFFSIRVARRRSNRANRAF